MSSADGKGLVSLSLCRITFTHDYVDNVSVFLFLFALMFSLNSVSAVSLSSLLPLSSLLVSPLLLLFFSSSPFLFSSSSPSLSSSGGRECDQSD